LLARALGIAADLGIADLVSASPQSIQDLVEQTGCDQDALYRLLRMLGGHGVFAEDEQGRFDLYHGRLRLKQADGSLYFDDVDYRDYEDHIQEQVKSWTYMKFPFIRSLGPEQGSYRVGPLARVNNCDAFSTPLAEAARQDFRNSAETALMQSTLAYHWARMIELLHCAESIRELLHDPDLSGHELVRKGELQDKGIGVIEAPRGTLFHHYEIDADGLITRANLIVSTTNNNTAMNESVRRVALDQLDGRELSEPLLNQIEVALRAYDPCLSCATHALGKMPLQITLLDASGHTLDQLSKDSNGQLHKCRD